MAPQKKASRTCTLDGCTAPVYAKKLCATHYRKQLPPRVCSFPECGRTLYAKKLCHQHYTMQRKGLPLRTIHEKGPRQKKPCSFEGCARPHYAKSLCQRHYEQKLDGSELRPLRTREQYLKDVRKRNTKMQKQQEPKGSGYHYFKDDILFITDTLPEDFPERVRKLLKRHNQMDLAEMLGVAA